MSLVTGILRGVGRGLRSSVRQGLWTTTSRQYSEVTVTEDNGQSVKMPSTARVVICGGGVLGTSIAYHLAERGWTDVVLLEQGRLTCGTTWHSAGLVGQAKDDVEGSQLVAYSRQLYKQLDKSHGVGWKECGSLIVAQTQDRLLYLQRKHSIALATGIDSHLISPKEAGKLCPSIRTDDLKGALWVPEDGALTPPDLVSAYTSIAKSKGVKFMEGVKIDQILTKNGRVAQVTTSHGDISCEYFVNCAGLVSLIHIVIE